jgi:hypothetical protein
MWEVGTQSQECRQIGYVKMDISFLSNNEDYSGESQLMSSKGKAKLELGTF